MKLELVIEGTDSESVITVQNRDLKFEISIIVEASPLYRINSCIPIPFFLSISQLLHISLIPFVLYEINERIVNRFEIGI